MTLINTATVADPGAADAPKIRPVQTPSFCPRTSTLTAPNLPSGCGGRSIGNHELNRSLRVAAMRAVIRSAPLNFRTKSKGSGNAAR